MNNSRNEQFINCELSSVLSNMMKSCTILLCPTQDANYPFVHCVYAIYPSHHWSLSSPLSYHSVCVQVPPTVD